MANNLESIVLYLKNALDKKLRLASLTARFDVANEKLKPTGIAGEYKYPQIEIEKGLVDYNRETGYGGGAGVNQVWKTFQCDYDRCQRITVDPVDDAQAAGVAIADAASTFMEQFVIPELDAIRFAQYAQNAGTTVQRTLSVDNIEAVYLEAIEAMEENEFPTDDFVIFCTPRVKNIFKTKYSSNRFMTFVDDKVGTKIESIDGHPIVTVPSSRFYSEIQLNASTGYFTPTGEIIEMLIISPKAVLQISDHEATRIFSPETYQQANAWAWDYRIFHGVHVVDNKKDGIYCVMKTPEVEEPTPDEPDPNL